MIIQSSLRRESRTAVMTREAEKELQKRGISCEYLDLRDVTLPFCDGRSFREYTIEYPDVLPIAEKLKQAESYIIAFPVYMYSISGVLKNFLDIFAGFMEQKYFGIILNAGGVNGYMASNDLVSFMRLDVGSTAVMPQVYSDKSQFEQLETGHWRLVHDKPKQKLGQMVDELVKKLKNKVIAAP